MEKSELEAERVTLFESVIKNQRSMKELESNLLHRLTSSEVPDFFIACFMYYIVWHYLLYFPCKQPLRKNKALS